MTLLGLRGWLAWKLARPFLTAEADRCHAYLDARDVPRGRTSPDIWEGGWHALVNVAADMRHGRTADRLPRPEGVAEPSSPIAAQ